jgi:2-oxoisovalerate dehydrogenase E1 component
LTLFSQGKLFGTVHTCIGQEFTGIAVADNLLVGDLIVSNHRCHGHYLARTGDVGGLMAEVMGRASGICGGRGGSQHICAGGVYSNGIQGGMLAVSAGMALAQKLAQTQNIVAAFIGDGTLGEGIVYETMNIASKWRLALMIVLEDNAYAQSTSQTQTMAGDVAKRAEAFDIPVFRGTTSEPAELIDVVAGAVGHVRQGDEPVFVWIKTQRLMAHSKGDDSRPPDEVKRYWAMDPLTRFAEEFPDEADTIKKIAEERVTSAVENALLSPFASNGPAEERNSSRPAWVRTQIDGRERVVARIHRALKEQLERDERAFFVGEDIEDPYGGAFKVTKDLSLTFPLRVRNTPISEAAIAGVSNGLALAGFHPVCEIMFGDFLTLVSDQIINHASKFRWMYNDQVEVPVVFRTPMGGKRGYGSTHSQCIEKHFLGVPGTRVLALHQRYDPYAVYNRLFATIDRPTLMIENKTLYGDYVTHQTAAGFWCEHTEEDFPTTRICSNAKPDITILCYGGTLADAEAALDTLFEEHEIVAEIICPTQIYPLRIEPIVDSAKVSGRLLIVEEGQLFCGFGAEVLAALQESLNGTPLIARRLGAAPHPLPCCKPAELECLPGVDSIVAASLEVVLRG